MDMEHERRLAQVEERIDQHDRRLDDIEHHQDNLNELVGTVKVLVVREENVENTVKEIKNDVKTLTSKPAQKWESLVEKIIGVAVGAIAGYVLFKMGF